MHLKDSNIFLVTDLLLTAQRYGAYGSVISKIHLTVSMEHLCFRSVKYSVTSVITKENSLGGTYNRFRRSKRGFFVEVIIYKVSPKPLIVEQNGKFIQFFRQIRHLYHSPQVEVKFFFSKVPFIKD